MPGKWKRTEPTKCDVMELRSVATKLAHEKAKALREAGLTVTGEVMSDLRKEAWAEAKAACKPVELTASSEQMETLKKVCRPCAERYQVKPGIEATPEADVSQEKSELLFTTVEEVKS